jgi:hypothetical protein
MRVNVCVLCVHSGMCACSRPCEPRRQAQGNLGDVGVEGVVRVSGCEVEEAARRAVVNAVALELQHTTVDHLERP